MQKPKLSVGIISNNRLHYLRATIESFVRCHKLDRIEFILVDNASEEAGLAEYVDSLSFVTHKVVRKCNFASAMNEIIERSSADFLLILPDDIQFIVSSSRWLEGCVRLLTRFPRIGSICFDAQRRSTIQQYFGGWRRWWQRVYVDPESGVKVVSYGRRKPGIVVAGINSLTRKEIWLRIGRWVSNDGKARFVDATHGAESAIKQRYDELGLKLERCLLTIPIAATIITDPGGFPAKVRGEKRYGRYIAPADGSFYYKILDPETVRHLEGRKPLPAFEDMVHPIGFELPLDAEGNLMKGNPIPGETEAAFVA